MKKEDAALEESWHLFKEAYAPRPLPAELEEIFIAEKPSWFELLHSYRWAFAAACASALMLLNPWRLKEPAERARQGIESLAYADIAGYEISKTRLLEEIK